MCPFNWRGWAGECAVSCCAFIWQGMNICSVSGPILSFQREATDRQIFCVHTKLGKQNRLRSSQYMMAFLI